MKRLLSVALGSVLLGTAVVAEEPEPIVVKASVSTAGPYGQLWTLTVTPEGKALLEVLYMLKPMGDIKGSFDLPEEDLASIRAAVAAHRFFDLPATIAPQASPLHMPDLRLDVKLGSRQAKVNLYNPAEILKDPAAKRFLRVWEATFAGIPLKPSW